jgi:hypothetical protein
LFQEQLGGCTTRKLDYPGLRLLKTLGIQATVDLDLQATGPKAHEIYAQLLMDRDLLPGQLPVLAEIYHGALEEFAIWFHPLAYLLYIPRHEGR